MKLKVVSFIFLLLSTQIFLSQSNYLKLIQKGKLSRVQKRLNKSIKKKPDDPGYNYCMAILYMNKKFKSYSPYVSYDYLKRSEDNYRKVSSEKELKNLNKLPLNYNVYENYRDTIYIRGLEDAISENTVETYEKYINYFNTADRKYITAATAKRDIAAYKIAKDKNTVESYQHFLEKYPLADQVGEATRERNSRAYELAKASDKIEAYKKFIGNYPDAADVPKAWERIHELAFEIAEKENTISSFESFIFQYPDAIQVKKAHEKIHYLAFNQAKLENTSAAMNKFLKTYPKSKEYQEAYKLYEELQFKENIVPGNWMSYKNFLSHYPKNSLVKRAQDSLVDMAIKTKDFQIIDYCVSTFCKDQNLINLHYEMYTKDGELSTLNRYRNLYRNSNVSRMANDQQYAEMADKFLLHLPYNPSNQNQYIDYVQNVWDKDMAYVVIQRMISPFIDKADYKGALKFLDGLPIDKNSKFYINLVSLLSSPIDKSIRPVALKGLNTTGNEFSPVPTADEKKIFFCGQNRNDNMGGEDIFEASGNKGIFIQPQLETNLSTQGSNEAPVSISSDGTLMLLFQSGKLYFSSKTSYGWSEITELDKKINNGEWQGDAMISSDGNSILFTAVRPNQTYNTNQIKDKNYHGDNLYPTDIFVSSKDLNGNWSVPINLGPIINTRYCERFPFLHPDMKTLYFSSDGHGGLGKMDVFKTTRLADTCWTCWTEPINMGKEINTSEDDAGYKISTSGDKAYFTLNKRKANETSVLFLLDVSGSMSGGKIAELKKVSKITCEDVINNNAEVAIAAFDGTCQDPIRYYLPFTKDYSQVENFIDNLRVNGGTPMYEAYFKASYILANNSDPKIKNKIMVLMTDGDASSCTRLDEVLAELKKNKKLFKTQTIAYQVAENSKAYLDLSLISTYSQGDFFHAASTEDLGSAFEKASGNIYEIVAGQDNKDLYSLNLPQHLRPDFVAKVSGKLMDSKNNPISTRIIWEDLESKKTIGIARTDPKDGAYFIVLPMGKNYGYYIEDSAFFPVSKNLDLRNTNKAIEIKNDISAVTFKEMIIDGVGVAINNLFFDFSKFDILPQSIPELKRVAKIIMRKNLNVEISGHTDNVGDDKTNQKLSEMRANSVKDFLIKEGCNPALLTTIGYGKNKPVATNDNETGRSKNRRVEMKFLK